MPPKAAYITTALAVADIRQSIRFYSLLGMELLDYEGKPEAPYWARMRGEGGDLMLLLKDPVDPAPRAERERFFLYLYTERLPELREHLLANGLKVSEITHPDYMKKGEICVTEPDGFLVFIGQWDPDTHKNWEAERRERLKKFTTK